MTTRTVTITLPMANVSLPAGTPEVDKIMVTVLYGNGDVAGTDVYPKPFPGSVTRSLAPGEYSVVVKGYAPDGNTVVGEVMTVPFTVDPAPDVVRSVPAAPVITVS